MLANNQEKQALALEISRILDAPPALAFKAWTSRDHLLRWWGPKDFTATSETMDFREGGAYRHNIHGPDGNSYGMSGIYREVVEAERIVFTFAWDGEPETLVTVTFLAEGSRTRLVFRQEPFADAANRDSHESGWGECLDRLVADLEA